MQKLRKGRKRKPKTVRFFIAFFSKFFLNFLLTFLRPLRSFASSASGQVRFLLRLAKFNIENTNGNTF